MSSASYFAPTYYSPYYFAPLASVSGGGSGPPPAPTGYRDRDAYAAIVGALEGLGEFAAVLLGNASDLGSSGADRVPLALVAPSEWTETDDADPVTPIRHVSYTVTLLVRDDDTGQRLDTLDRLSSLVQNALDGTNLGGECLPALTKIRRGRYDPTARHPEQRLILEGDFTYIISSLTSHDTSY